ncbi:unnamed protein product [Durusdinium trenchii]|uniref:Uncharacterized protein n=1 Tax=Durusdinium trenchii TaxID=1381693 RepID=A0ABP0K9Q7_9DINO
MGSLVAHGVDGVLRFQELQGQEVRRWNATAAALNAVRKQWRFTRGLCWDGEAVVILHHATTIREGYQAMIHCGIIRQCAAVKHMSCELLRSGDKAIVTFRWCYHAEYISLGETLLFREGRTKGLGKIIEVLDDGYTPPWLASRRPGRLFETVYCETGMAEHGEERGVAFLSPERVMLEVGSKPTSAQQLKNSWVKASQRQAWNGPGPMALYPFIESDQVMPWLEIQHLSDVTFKSNSLPVAGSRAEQRFVVTRAWKREKKGMKVVLIGDSSVGKSALVYRFINNKLLSDPKATVGISFFKQSLWDPQMNQQYPMQIWDTAGQEKFQSVTTHHYRAADGALLVFDIANERSFQNLDKWLTELRENTDPSVVVALVGTKTDLASQRQVATERAQSYARSNGLLYVETSAYWNKFEGGDKDLAVGVEQIFLRLLRGILQKQKELGRNPARLDMSGYPEAINLEEEGRPQNECAC